MDNLQYFYQHIPHRIDPVAFSILGFSVDWYSLMYLAGFLAVYLLLGSRLRKGEGGAIFDSNSKFKISNQNQNYKIAGMLLDVMLVTFLGLLLGGRLGYVLFYNLPYYAAHPLEIVSPYDPLTQSFTGIYGMSFHGGLIGALSAAWIFIRSRKMNFWQWANFVAPAIPAGYFFGRVGNFLNGELYGRVTQKFWGMYFPGDPYGLLRHPSEIYEAFLEGVVLFFVFWPLRNHSKLKNHLLALYIIGYAVMRIFAEFFREPDPQVGYVFGLFTLGQLLSLGMLIFGIALILVRQKNKKVV